MNLSNIFEDPGLAAVYDFYRPKPYKFELKFAELPDGPMQIMQTHFGQHNDVNRPIYLETVFGNRNIHESIDGPNYDDFVHNDAALSHNNITKDHIHALTQFTRESKDVNNALLNRSSNGCQLHASHSGVIDSLDSMFSEQKTQKEFHVYSGVRYSPTVHFQNHNDIAVAHHPTYMSTSSDLDQANKFVGYSRHDNDLLHGITESDPKGSLHILKIKIPTGSQAVSVAPISSYPSEKEVLINRGAIVKIHPKPTQHGSNTYIWDAELIGHHSKPIKD